jgi:hypothetical protein
MFKLSFIKRSIHSLNFDNKISLGYGDLNPINKEVKHSSVVLAKGNEYQNSYNSKSSSSYYGERRVPSPHPFQRNRYRAVYSNNMNSQLPNNQISIDRTHPPVSYNRIFRGNTYPLIPSQYSQEYYNQRYSSGSYVQTPHSELSDRSMYFGCGNNGNMVVMSQPVRSSYSTMPEVPATPVYSKNTSPETMSPLFSSERSISIQKTPAASNLTVPRLNEYDTRYSYESNNTNHSTVNTTDYDASTIDINVRRRQIEYGYQRRLIEEGIDSSVGQYRTEEFDIPKKGFTGKLKLGFKYLDNKLYNVESKLDSIYVKYHDVSKRHLFWTI